MFRRSFLAVVGAVCASAIGAVGLAWATQTLPAPSGRVILSISGNITSTNGDNIAAFDRSMLEGLTVTRIRTTTPWTEGVREFEGVLARDLMALLGAEGTIVIATALNDYKVEIPVSDFVRYPVLLAISMDGVPLGIRDKGPVWIIYPQDDYAELNTETTQHKWIWQLKSLHFS